MHREKKPSQLFPTRFIEADCTMVKKGGQVSHLQWECLLTGCDCEESFNSMEITP